MSIMSLVKMLWLRLVYLLCYFGSVRSEGLLLLYRPIDVSNDCAFSGRLRYDLSFGMGMSDTITMVLRTLKSIDYECSVEISSTKDIYLVVVIKFPTNLLQNCLANEDTFVVMKKNKCLRLCDLVGDRDLYSTYFVITVRERLRFRFISNSSINSDINADMYQVTATSARWKPNKQECYLRNETLCIINRQEYCFTSGVVCDGIKNCGVKDWFDERQSECSLPVEYLGYSSVVAIVGALACAVLAASHILMRCLPPLAGSFFIFNANEDNRLCIDPILEPPEQVLRSFEKYTKGSLIPVASSSSSDGILRSEGGQNITYEPEMDSAMTLKDVAGTTKRITVVKSMTLKLHEKLRSFAGRGKLLRTSYLDQQMSEV